MNSRNHTVPSLIAALGAALSLGLQATPALAQGDADHSRTGRPDEITQKGTPSRREEPDSRKRLPSKEDGEKDRNSPTAETKRPKPQPGGAGTARINPLVIPPIQKGVLPADPDDRRNGPGFADYRTDPGPAGMKDKGKDLPLFGYDFFQSAREIIDAHRAYVRRQFNGNEPVSSKPAKRQAKPKDETEQVEDDEQPTTVMQENRSRDRSEDRSQDGVKKGTAKDDRTDTADDEQTFSERNRSSRKTSREQQEPVNAFQDVADPLSQLYRNVTATVPPTYQLAPNDTLTVRYWSARQEARTVTATVDPQGAIALEDIGNVVVRGLTMDQTEKLLRSQFRRFFNGVEVSVTLGKLRTIQITVSGAAYQPGTYAVPAVATAYNVLYAAGGPTEDGTLRNIEIRREGKLVATLDVYKFLTVGAQANDVQLQTGDLIYIPHRRSRILVSGEVLQPAVFELRTEEKLSDVLRYCGGVKPSGVDQRLRISTLVPGTARVLKDIDLKDAATAGTIPLYDGDEVEIFSVRPMLTNSVIVEGAVDQPSEYALIPGMKVSDLISRARGPLGEAYLVRADLYRWNPDNTSTLIPIDLEKALAHDPKADVPLTKWDRLKVYTREEVAWTGRRTVSVRGAVQRPGMYNQSGNMRVSDLLRMAGGPTPDAYMDRAILLHQNGDGTYDMEYVSLAAAARPESDKDPMLKDNDVLAIYKTGEAQFEPERVVTIRGEVVSPGPYPRSQGMKLSDLLNMAGGFKPNAFTSVSVAHARRVVDSGDKPLQIVSVTFDDKGRCAPQDDVRLEDGDVITVQGLGGYVEKVQIVNVQGAVNKPGPIILTSKTMRMSDAIKQAGGLRKEAFPQGAEFSRDPQLLATTGQRNVAELIGGLNDLLNEQTYNRERGKSFIERMKAINTVPPSNDSLLGRSGGSNPSPLTGAAATELATRFSNQEIVTPARKLTSHEIDPNGSIAVDLPGALRKPGGADDILLADGDTITVPEAPTTVHVTGAVFSKRGVLYKPGAKLDHYIAQAGGFAPDAAIDRIEIIHIGGGLIPANKVKEIQPGDVILVPTRVLAEKITTHQNTLDSIFKSLTNSAIVFRLATGIFGF
jgi:polysaccharide biosynthesis/export protein